MHRMAILLLTSLSSLAATGQDTASLDGPWVMRFLAANGEKREARIAITNGSGTYRLLVNRNRENPCLGLETPVTMAMPSADVLSLAVHGSQALAGCPDNRWQLKRIDDKSFQGTYADGRPFVLSRP